MMAAATLDIRAQVVNGLEDGPRGFVEAADAMEAAIRSGDFARVLAAGRRLVIARDRYLRPMIERAERGEPW
jgi:hypothetical protein